MVYSQSADSPEDIIIRKPIEEAVDGHGHVPRLYRTGVQIPVILWQEIYVVEYEALEVLSNCGSRGIENIGRVMNTCCLTASAAPTFISMARLNGVLPSCSTTYTPYITSRSHLIRAKKGKQNIQFGK